jgi:hypothetical protein
MPRVTFRLLIALLTFSLGLTLVWMLHLFARVEDSLVELATQSSTADSSSIPPVAFFSADDTDEIYRAVIRENYIFEGVVNRTVIAAETTSYPFFEDEAFRIKRGDSESFYTLVRKTMPGVGLDTLSDYLAENRESKPLKVSDLGIPYVLISSYELNEMPRGNNGVYFWTEFYKRYPDSSGLISFSDIGFNKQHTEAFVYAARSCGGLCGGGDYVWLAKVDGHWIIKKQQGLWVS